MVRRLLAERDFPVASIRFFASARSAGTTLPWKGRDDRGRRRRDRRSGRPRHRDLLRRRRRRHASRRPRFAAAGVLVIDNSSAPPHGPRRPAGRQRGQSRTRSRQARKGIIANPNCTTMAAMPVLKVLHAEAGLERLIVSTYQAVSGSGIAGGRGAARPGEGVLAQRHHRARARRRVRRLPRSRRRSRARSRSMSSRSPAPSSTTGSTRRMRRRSCATRAARSSSCRSSASPAPACACPVFTGHSLSINAEFAREHHARARARAARGCSRRRSSKRCRRRCRRPARTRASSAASAQTSARRRQGPRAVHQQRQPAQGRRAQRRADRRLVAAGELGVTASDTAGGRALGARLN